MSILHIENLTKTFGGFTAVDNFNLDLEAGQIYAILGPNGAGKTTTIKMIMGILKPDAGGIFVDGFALTDAREKVLSKIGFLPDEPYFHDYLKGYEVLQFVGDLRRLSKSTIKENIEKYVALFQLEEAIEDYAVNYSLGMKKRLGLIAALIHHPPLVILDEPVNGLDPHGVKTLHNFIQDYAAQGNTVIYSTHVLAQAEKLCKSIGIMHKGKLIRNSSLESLKADYPNLKDLEEIFLELTKEDA